jgi:hypothetical protein
MALAVALAIALPMTTAATESDDPTGTRALEVDAIGVAPDQASVLPTSRTVVVTVTAIDVPPARRPKARR